VQWNQGVVYRNSHQEHSGFTCARACAGPAVTMLSMRHNPIGVCYFCSAGRFNRAQVVEVLNAAKWIMLLFMLCEVVALVLSLLLRFVLEDPNGPVQYDNFDTNNLQVGECEAHPATSVAAVQ
jgi:hypothetical protein